MQVNFPDSKKNGIKTLFNKVSVLNRLWELCTYQSAGVIVMQISHGLSILAGFERVQDAHGILLAHLDIVAATAPAPRFARYYSEKIH